MHRRITFFKLKTHDKETGEQSDPFFSAIQKDFDSRDGPIARLTQAQSLMGLIRRLLA